MMCPECKSTNVRCLYLSPTRPEEDKWNCVECGHNFLRYDQTEYETKEERDRRIRKLNR